MLDPTPEQLANLGGFERLAFRLSQEVNRRPLLKRLAQGYLRTVGTTWIHLCTRNLLHVTGLEKVSTLKPDRGVVLVCNHRSFFDLYVVSSLLLRHASWIRRVYFPVRGNYFYERLDGVLVNLVMSALAMFPPLMREGAKRSFNQYSIRVLEEFAREPGVLLGLHPEGTRSRTNDPYELLPAQIGVGQVVHRARPVVIPVFLLGLGNNLLTQVRGNFNRTGRPITVVFGSPIDLQEYFEEPAKLRTYKRIAEQLRLEIMNLGAREREIRSNLASPN